MDRVKTHVVLALALALAGCEKYALDWQMEELCKVDGGIVVYETVHLPPSRFNPDGTLVPVVPHREGMPLAEHLLGKDYAIEHSFKTIKEGHTFGRMFSEGRLRRYQEVIRRISDQKILAAEVSYGRVGGEITFNHPSQSFCPDPRPTPGLLTSTFRKGS